MALFSFSTGDRITSARLNGPYNLLKGVAGGTDTITLISGSALDMSACQTSSGFKPPATAGAAPTAEGVIAFDTTADNLVWGDGSNTKSALSNPMTTTADMIVGGAAGAPTKLAKGTAGQLLQMSSGASSIVWGPLAAESTASLTSALVGLSTGAGYTDLLSLTSITAGRWLGTATGHFGAGAGAAAYVQMRVFESGTSTVKAITGGQIAANQIESFSLSFVDSPATTATYKFQAKADNPASARDTAGLDGTTGVTWITAVKIG